MVIRLLLYGFWVTFRRTWSTVTKTQLIRVKLMEAFFIQNTRKYEKIAGFSRQIAGFSKQIAGFSRRNPRYDFAYFWKIANFAKFGFSSKNGAERINYQPISM